MISQIVTQWLAVGTGVLSVPLASLLKAKGWDTRVKFALSAVVSVLASLGISIPVDANNAGVVNYGTTAATALASAQILYHLFFKGTKLEDKLASSFVKDKNAAE